MMDSLLKRIENNRKARGRWIAMILCLSMLVSLGTFAGFHKTAVAKVYTREVLDCPYTHEGTEPVAHTHNADCYDGETLVCRLPEIEAHTHTDACYTERQVLKCGLEENPGHQHTDACYTEREVLKCGLEENPGHQHTGTCYNADGALICTIPVGEGAHEHTPECYETVRELTCTIPEGEGAHTHTAECYETVRELICDKPELPVHVHGPECFRTEEITVDEPEQTTEPEQTAEPETTAQPEEKTLPEMPVGDPNADLESASNWERDFDGMELSGNWATDLVLVAATQQGHGESPNNFEAVLNDAGDAWIKHGYTRYGAWYGAPYAEEWSAMFVSFCLRYAGIPAENVPNNPTAAYMAESFQQGELFAGRDYVPAVGDLIFFDTEKAEGIDHMGIVCYVDEDDGTINTVEGGRSDAVETFGYHLDDEEIAGYGILPQNPDYVPAEEEDEDEDPDAVIVMTTDEEENEEKKANEETKDTVEETVPAVAMPAQSWERTAGGIKVVVEAPEGAFPENTKIAVTPVNGNSLKDTVSDAVDGEVLEVQAVDITFFDADGHEIEPAIPIRVVMTPAATQHAEEKTSVVHVDVAQQTAELIEQAAGTELDNSEVVFDADAFTIYAIVYTVDTYFRSWTGETFRVTMDFDENAGIPQNAELVVEEILEESADYSNLLSQTENALDGNKQISFVRFFDISIMADGKEVQPLAPVSMKIQLADLPEETTAADAQIIHFGDRPEVLTAEAAGANVSFETSSFSVYGVVYTVDFEYEVDGQVYQFSMQGGTSITLSELIEILHVNSSDLTTAEFMSQIAAVNFSSPALVEVVKTENDWILYSLQPFETYETLTVTMLDGQQFVVQVTDENSYSSDLGDFVSSVTINADKEAGKYVIKPGKTYSAHISFKEDQDGKQFAENGHLEYSFPDGFTPAATTGTFTIIATSRGVEYPVEGNTYRVENGKLIIDLNTNSPNYQYVESSSISTLDLNIEGVFDTTKNTITWSDTVSTDIKPDLDQGVSIEKSITSFDPATGVITYQLKVKSLNGTNNNIVVSDHMDGTAVAIDQNVTLSGANMSSDGVTYTRLGWGDNTVNGFSFSIPQMAAGQEATVTYTATIDKTKLIAQGVNLHDDGQNHVNAKPEDPGKPDSDSQNLRNTITSPTLTKGATVSDAVNGKRTITWTIEAISTEYFSLAGQTITDTIQAASRSDMKYSGAGLKIVVTDGNGSSQTRTVPWRDVGVNNLNSDYSWTYNVPAGDTGNKTYLITYTTEVDVSDFVANTTLKNDVQDPYNNTTGSIEVGPDEEDKKAQLDKKVGEVSLDDIEWSVDITVPTQGLNKAQLTDDLPTQRDGAYHDILHGSVDDVQVSGLIEGQERAEKSYSNYQLVINFQKLVNGEWVDGLIGGNEPRMITVSFETDNNQNWITDAETETWLREHTNNVKFEANRQVLTDSATGTPMKSTFTKEVEKSGEVTVDGEKLPIYYYTINLTGVTGPFDISDSFDPRLIPAEEYLYSDQGKVYGGDQYYQGMAGSEAASFEQTGDGSMTIHVTENNLATNGPGYYSHYKICYALRVKDAAALESLKAEAAATQGGKISLTNTAESLYGKDEAEVTFEHRILTKELLNKEALGESTNIGEFRIVINPDGYDLDPESDMLTLTDTFTNLSIDYNSIKVEPSEGATWYVSGGKATFTLPDETPLVITYKAKVIGNGDIHFDNTAEIKGQKAIISDTKNVNSDMGGTAGNFNIKILKHKRYDFTEVLGGAKFGLFTASDGLPVKDINYNAVTFITDADGKAYVEGSQSKDGWSLHAGTLYYLQELEAPEGYNLSTTQYKFQINTDNVPDYDNNIYFNGDTLHINNTPKGGLEVSKSVYGTELDDAQKNAIVFTVTKPDGTTVSKRYSEFTNGKWKLTDLTAGNYTVTETCGEVDGYTRTTSYIVDPNTANLNDAETSGTGESASVTISDPNVEASVSFVNRYKSTVEIEPETLQLKVMKKWFVGEEDKSLSDEFTNETAEITLKRYRASAPQTLLKFYRWIENKQEIADPVSVPAGATVSLTPSKGVNARPMQEGTAGMYNDTGYAAASYANAGNTILFNFSEQESVSVIEIWFDNDPGTVSVSSTGGATVSDNSFSKDTTYTGETATITGGGSKTFNNLPLTEKIDGSTYAYKYYVEETAKEGFTTQYQVGSGEFMESISSSDAVGIDGNETIVVKNTKTTSQLGFLTLKKTSDLTGEDAETKIYKIAIKNSDDKYVNQDGTVPESSDPVWVEFKADDEKTWSNLPTGNYTIEENEDSAKVNGNAWTWNIEAEEGVTIEDKTVTVAEGETKATVKNTYTDTVEISATKSWGEGTEPAHAVQFTLYQEVTEETENAIKIGEKWYKKVVNDADGVELVNPAAIVATEASDGNGGFTYTWPSEENSKVSWSNLPKKEGGIEIQYLVKETGVYFGRLTEDNPETEDVDESGKVPETGIWSSISGYVVTPSDSIAVTPGIDGSRTAAFTNSVESKGVKLKKTWDSHVTENMSWEATFVLEELEYPYADRDGYVTYDAERAHDDAEHSGNWTEVSPRVEFTISSSDSDIGTIQALQNLPKFRTKDDGKVYILMYSVTEIGYKVWSNPNQSGDPIYSWTKGGEYLGDVHFTPEYLEDADEFTNYTIEVKNSERNEKENIFIDFDLKKEWAPVEDGIDTSNNSYATFQLKRKYHQEYKSLNDPDVDYSQFVTVRLVDAAGRELTSLQVEKNAQIKFQAAFKAGMDGIGTADFVSLDGTHGHVMISNPTALPNQTLVSSQPFRVNADETYQYSSGADYLADGIYGVVISDRCDGVATADTDDDAFNSRNYQYRIDKNTGYVVNYSDGEVTGSNNNNGWTLEFHDFPQTLIDTGTDRETTTVYGYYFEEVDSSPRWPVTYYQADSAGNKTGILNGDADNRIYFDDHVIAENKKTHLLIKKYWESEVQSEMPNLVVDIKKIEVDQGFNVNVNADSQSFRKVILTAENNFEYELYNLETNRQGGYWAYVPWELGITVSKPGDDGVDADGTITDDTKVVIIPISNQNFDNPTYVAAKEGDTINWMRIKAENLSRTNFTELPAKSDIIRYGSGTIGIVNNPKKTGFQLAIRKRWHKFTTDGGLTTESNYDGAYFTAMMVQIVKDAETHEEISRHDYGSKFEWHFDGNTNFTYKDPGKESNITVRYSNGQWLVVIPEGQGSDGSNLPQYGYYTKSDGAIGIAEYDYTVREISVTSTDGYHWAISDHIQQGSAQDLEGMGVNGTGHIWMLDNYPDADLKIIKHWPTKSTNQGVTAVYFKITDTNGKNVIEDIVEKKNYKEHQLTPGDVAEYNGEWCLVVRGATNSTDDWVGYVDHLPLFDFSKTVFGDGTIPAGGMPGELNYNVEEVAAVNSEGNLVSANNLYIPYYEVTTRGTKGSIRASADGIQLGMYDVVDGKEVLQPTIVEVTNNANTNLEVEKRFFEMNEEDGTVTQVNPLEVAEWITEDGNAISRIEYIVKVDVTKVTTTTDADGKPVSETETSTGYVTSGWKTGAALADNESGAKVFTLRFATESAKTEEQGVYWSDQPNDLQGLPSVKIIDDGKTVFRYVYSIIEKAVYAGDSEVKAFIMDNRYDDNKEVWKLSNTRTKDEYTHFEFTKEWCTALSEEPVDWPEDKEIQVQVYRTKNGESDGTFQLNYKITNANKDSSTGIEADTDSLYPDGTSPKLQYKTDTKYTYELQNLLKKRGNDEYVYYVKELTTIDGYATAMYFQIDSNGQLQPMARGSANGDHANNGGKILNKENPGYELPQTGGIGTTLFTALGGLMTVTAGAILTIRRKKQYS